MALAGLCRALPRLSVQPIRSVAGCSALASRMRETGTVHNMSVEVKGRAASRARASAQAVHTSCWSASSISVTVPPLGESISDGTIASVLKQVGDSVAEDEAIVQIETDKVTVDVRAPQAGVLEKLLVSNGGAGGDACVRPRVLLNFCPDAWSVSARHRHVLYMSVSTCCTQAPHAHTGTRFRPMRMSSLAQWSH